MSLVEVIRRQEFEIVNESNFNIKDAHPSEKSLTRFVIWIDDCKSRNMSHGDRFKVYDVKNNGSISIEPRTMEIVRPKKITKDEERRFDFGTYRTKLKPFLEKRAIQEAIVNICYSYECQLTPESLTDALKQIVGPWTTRTPDNYNNDLAIIVKCARSNGEIYVPRPLEDFIK